MLVLLTRAAEDAVRTRARLEAMGHRVLIAPVITIEPLGSQWPPGAIDAVVATSSHAFRSPPIAWGPSPEARRLLPLWLVGGRTCDAARVKGYQGPAFVAPNAVVLALEMTRHPIGKVVYLAGKNRKTDVETALAVTNHQVEVVETYEAIRARFLPEQLLSTFIQTLHSDQPVAVLHYSRRSSEIFAELFVEAFRDHDLAKRAIHLCLSADVAQPLSLLGYDIRFPDLAKEDDLLALIRHLI